MSVWDITENDLQKSLFLHYGQKRSSFKKFIGRVYLNLLYCFETDRKKRERNRGGFQNELLGCMIFGNSSKVHDKNVPVFNEQSYLPIRLTANFYC